MYAYSTTCCKLHIHKRHNPSSYSDSKQDRCTYSFLAWSAHPRSEIKILGLSPLGFLYYPRFEPSRVVVSDPGVWYRLYSILDLICAVGGGPLWKAVGGFLHFTGIGLGNL